MRKTKTIGVLIVLMLSLVLLAFNASSALVITEPNATGADRINFNLTLESIPGQEAIGTAPGNETDKIVNCNMTLTNTLTANASLTIQFGADGGGASRFTNISGPGLTGDAGSWTYSGAFYWREIEDGVNYTVSTIVCINTTGDQTDNDTSQIDQALMIDHSTPTTPVLSAAELYNDLVFSQKENVNITTTVNDNETVDCVITFMNSNRWPNNNKEYTYNASGNCNFDSSIVDEWNLPDGIYRYMIAASDGYNCSSNTSEREFQIKEGGMSNALKANILQQAGYDLSSLSLGGLTEKNNIIPILVLGILAYLLFVKKKKR